ncbi:myeloid differentiation primary response protein MyD88-like [Centruroides sculpturatus]|uniref:myeloid differentiation primary response protein MyD88-like n=2 Tax=Centruroides sculpturatus TaxID=218467 RepID=UPI000C6D369E|nr:myeloid differentiation primary response protein MyD88-like [Centruroides sculpturatus]
MAGAEYNYNNIPAKVLNVSSRNLLYKLLNPPMEIPTERFLCKDYRGLAELMEFDYMTIRSFEATGNPTKKLIEEWELLPNSTIGNLLEMLKQIERYDVIDDIEPLIERDVKSFVMRRQRSHEAPVQVAEVSSGSRYISEYEDEDVLTRDDVYIRQSTNGAEVAYFDAYVCFAEEDSDFVYKLAEYLESPEIGIKLCIKERNLLAGVDIYEALVRIIEERCSRMLIILSPEFLNSAECKFQTRYATGLAVAQRQRKLIPLMYKPCPMPTLLKYVSKVDFTKPDVYDWIWKKLLISIKGTLNDNVALPSPTFCHPLYLASQTCYPNFTHQSLPMLTLPNRSRSRSISPQPSTMTSSSLAASTSSLSVSSATNTVSKSVSPVHRRRWLTKFSEIFSSSSSHSNSGNTSSGFHSQSDSHLVSNDIVEQMV